MTFQPNEAGIRALYEQVGAKIKVMDKELRSRQLVGQPLDVIRPQVVQSLARIGIDLPAAKIDEYSQSIADGKDFEFVLT